MVQLTSLHYIYIIMVLVVVITMLFRKDTVLPCIIGLLVIGYVYSGSLLTGTQVVFNALIASGNQFWNIIVVISLIVAMSRSLKDIGADRLMVTPIQRVVVNPKVAFFSLGIVMMLFSWFLWPSPAVALVGAIMLPATIKAGLPPIWAAAAINIFGHGIALSSDFFIQGAPAITSRAAAIQDPLALIQTGLPLWLTMSVTTIICSYFMMKKDLAPCSHAEIAATAETEEQKDFKPTFGVYLVAIVVPLVFLTNIVVMYVYQLQGADATALVGGTAILVMAFVSIIEHSFINSFDKISEYIKEGFVFGIKIFAPVVIIGAFFFLGSESIAKQILGPEATGLLTDLGLYLADNVTLSRFPVALIQMVIGGITGLDGSGFSGLPLVGSLAQTFSSAVPVNREGLAMLGQITSIWVGGGTIIPWGGTIAVAAICNVSPLDLARKNFIPVIVGFIATFIVAMFIL